MTDTKTAEEGLSSRPSYSTATVGLNPLVLDCGSGLTKAGYASGDAPEWVVPTVVRRPPLDQIGGMDDILVGLDALSLDGKRVPKKSKLEHAVARGQVKSWDDIEHLWHWLYNSHLRTPSDDTSLFLCHSAASPTFHKAIAAQMLFETFNLGNLSVYSEAPLALLATTGKDTGVVVDSGAGVTTATAVCGGTVVNSHISKIELGGDDLTAYLGGLMRKVCKVPKDLKSRMNPAKWNSDWSGFKLVNELKETLCCVSTKDYAAAIDDKNPLNQTIPFKLPDGNVLQVPPRVVYATELLFEPAASGDKYVMAAMGLGIPSLVLECVEVCAGLREATKKATADGVTPTRDIHDPSVVANEELYGELMANVTLCGGNTLFRGMSERFGASVTQLVAASKLTPVKVNVVSDPNRGFASWLGGAILCDMPDLQNDLFVSRADFLEQGASAILRKCP